MRRIITRSKAALANLLSVGTGERCLASIRWCSQYAEQPLVVSVGIVPTFLGKWMGFVPTTLRDSRNSPSISTTSNHHYLNRVILETECLWECKWILFYVD